MRSTPPWTIELEPGPRARKTIAIVAARGIVARLGDTTMPGAMDDAELIVRAVNAHAALVQALEAMVKDTETLFAATAKSGMLPGYELARKALAKVRA